MTFRFKMLQSWLTILFLVAPAHHRAGISASKTGQDIKATDLIVKRDGELALISINLKQLKALEEKGKVFPISVRVDKSRIISRYCKKGTRAKLLVYENNGKGSWHGVYNLVGEKNNLSVRFPSGGSIKWSGLNYRQALQRQLVLTGLKTSGAKSILDRYEKSWFKEGLHVFYVLDAADAKMTLKKEIPDGVSVVLIKVEIKQE